MSASQSDPAQRCGRRKKKPEKPNLSRRPYLKSKHMTLRDAAFLLAGYLGGYAAASDKEER